MPEYPDEPLSVVRQRLLDGLFDNMMADEFENSPNPNCTYTQNDIDRCARLVDRYLAAIAGIQQADQAAIRELVKDTVLKLNSLNKNAGEALFETDHREDLCQILLVAARRAGLDTSEDITESWRDW